MNQEHHLYFLCYQVSPWYLASQTDSVQQSSALGENDPVLKSVHEMNINVKLYLSRADSPVNANF